MRAIRVTESQLVRLLKESEHEYYYQRHKASESLKNLWAAIEKKQAALEKELFGNIEKDIDKLTKQKMGAFKSEENANGEDKKYRANYSVPSIMFSARQ